MIFWELLLIKIDKLTNKTSLTGQSLTPLNPFMKKINSDDSGSIQVIKIRTESIDETKQIGDL